MSSFAQRNPSTRSASDVTWRRKCEESWGTISATILKWQNRIDMNVEITCTWIMKRRISKKCVTATRPKQKLLNRTGAQINNSYSERYFCAAFVFSPRPPLMTLFLFFHISLSPMHFEIFLHRYHVERKNANVVASGRLVFTNFITHLIYVSPSNFFPWEFIAEWRYLWGLLYEIIIVYKK